MSKLNIKNGTPVGNEHLCRSCSNGQFTVGYRAAEVIVICANATPARLIPFPVYECSAYWDRNRPGYDEMRKLALNFGDYRRRPTVGFRDKDGAHLAAIAASEAEDEDEAVVKRWLRQNQNCRWRRARILQWRSPRKRWRRFESCR